MLVIIARNFILPTPEGFLSARFRCGVGGGGSQGKRSHMKQYENVGALCMEGKTDKDERGRGKGKHSDGETTSSMPFIPLQIFKKKKPKETQRKL